MAEAGGEAALMALTTLMLSSGSGGRLRRSRPRTFISWSSSKPPKVNWKTRVGDRNRLWANACGTLVTAVVHVNNKQEGAHKNATQAKVQKKHRN